MITSEPIPDRNDAEKGTAWHGISELHRAALASANDVRSLLLKGADVTVQNNFGETPLHYACQAGNWGGVFQLLLFGANLYDVDKGGRWCIHHAARSGCLLTFQYLEFLGVNRWQRDKKGRNALHFAVEHGHIELIKYLIKQKDVDLRMKDNKNRTAMHEAVLQTNRHVCWVLESKSEDSLLNDQDSNGETPIDYAISKTNGLQLPKDLRRWQTLRKTNGKLDVPQMSRLVPLITPSTGTLLIALNIWYFHSRVAMTCLNLVIFLFAYFYAMTPHRLWHISRAPNTGLLGWFFGSVILSLLIYFTVLLPKIWPDYGFTIFSLVMVVLFTVSLRGVFADPGLSDDTRFDTDGNPMGIIDVVSARIRSSEYCSRCKTAYPSRTKHCRLCDCCYKGLDHHCLFLMTCIAINNHGAFLAMVFTVFIAQFTYVRGALMYFWSFCQSHQEMPYLDVLGTEPLISVYLFVNLLGLWWTLTLLLFQIKIISEGGTTYFLPNGEPRTRIDCIHATGTIGELTISQRFRHLKQFIQYYYLPSMSKENTAHPHRLQQV